MKVVLDTNALIQSLPKKSPYRLVWDKYLEGSVELCVSTDILEEYEEILQKLIDLETAQLVLEVILNNPHTYHINPQYSLKMIEADPDDNKFVDCAFAANAKYIVTNDHHYNVLKNIQWPNLEVISLSNFAKSL